MCHDKWVTSVVSEVVFVYSDVLSELKVFDDFSESERRYTVQTGYPELVQLRSIQNLPRCGGGTTVYRWNRRGGRQMHGQIDKSIFEQLPVPILFQILESFFFWIKTEYANCIWHTNFGNICEWKMFDTRDYDLSTMCVRTLSDELANKITQVFCNNNAGEALSSVWNESILLLNLPIKTKPSNVRTSI